MDELQQALNVHERVRKSTDLPLFFGRKEKDTVSPNVLLDRINRAAGIAGWNMDERKCTEFYLILRDRALTWWDSLENYDNVDRNIWADVQKEFLAAYAPKFTARTTCTNFQDLVQRNAENVQDYYLRVAEAFKKMCDSKPEAINTVRANRGAATAETAAGLKKEGVVDIERFFLHQLFIAGLKEEIRTKIMEAGKTSIQESVNLARELEVIQNDKKKTGAVANVIANATVNDNTNKTEDELDDDEINAVNSVRFQKGKPALQSFKRAGPFLQTGQPSRPQQLPSFNNKCRYCTIPGHSQKVCRKRIAAGAPCVDAQGKPYANQTNRRVQAVQGHAATASTANAAPASHNSIQLNW